MNLQFVLSESDALTESQIRRYVAGIVESEGSQKDAAKLLGVSSQFVGDVLRGRRAVGKTLAAQFAYKPVTIYVPVDAEATQ